MAFERYKTQVLLLHSEQRTLDVLSAGFNDKYTVHCATSGTEALNTLTETPIHVMVSAQELSGMSGLDAIREARKRSPDTLGILLAGTDKEDGLEALVGDEEVFEIVRGDVTADSLIDLIESATKRVRLMALSHSANDNAANVDEPGEHIVMETADNGSTIISDGTGRLPILQNNKIEIGTEAGSRGVDVLVLTRDEEFLATIKDSARGMHHVHHAVTPTQAEDYAHEHKIGVLVTDAAMVGSNVEALTHKLRCERPRMVAIVAGRRDDGEMLMDLINRGHVYRFLLKPVSPGRARLAIEASVKHHLEAPDSAFKPKSQSAPPPPKPVAKPRPVPKPVIRKEPKPAPKPKPAPVIKAEPKAKAKPEPQPKARKTEEAPERIIPTVSASPVDVGLDDAFDDESSFTATMTGIAESVGKSLSSAGSLAGRAQDAVKASKKAVAGVLDNGMGPLKNPKTLGIAGGSVAAIAIIAWVVSSWDSGPEEAVPEQTAFVPTFAESDVTFTPPAQETQVLEPEPEPEIVVLPYQALLDEARAARDAGRLIEPAGDNAVELYLVVLEEAPDDPVMNGELDDIVGQVLGMAETAILEQNVIDANAALSMVRLADSDNPRLTFIDAQLTQLQLRSTVDAARQFIRDRNFEEADRLISEARSVAGAESVEVNLLTQELSNERNQQQVEEILTTANDRLEAGNLITPNNDNARYYFERALAMEESNQAAQTGLTVVASKLVLQAREAIDNARLADAGNLLREARALDPASSDLAASTKALDTALEEIAEAERQAEAARLAELERQAEIERQAEADRLAELERQRELERQAEAARLEELREQAELERQAEIERLARLEREAEEARLAEIERKAEEARQAELREMQRQESERQAAAAATASALGVAGSTVKDASSTPVPSFAAPRNSSSEPVQSSSNTTRETVTPPPTSTQGQTPPAPAQQSSGSTVGATTYGMGDSTTVTFGETATQAAVPAGSTQTLATDNNVIETLNNARNNEPEVDPTVAISTLTRTNYVAPVYPRSAQRRNVTGSVDVMFTVSAIGTVTDISVIDAEPGDTFNQAAMNAVAKWRFEPVIENGRAVEKRTAVRLAFDLQ